MTKDELCTCGHAGRDHDLKLSRGTITKDTSDKRAHGLCLVAACPCTRPERVTPQPEAKPSDVAQAYDVPAGMIPGFFV